MQQCITRMPVPIVPTKKGNLKYAYRQLVVTCNSTNKTCQLQWCLKKLSFAIIENENFCLYYCKGQLLSAPLLTVCIFQVPLFCRYYWNWHSCYALLHMIFLHYVSQNIQIILHLTTFVCTCYVWLQCTITIDMLYCNRKLFYALL